MRRNVRIMARPLNPLTGNVKLTLQNSAAMAWNAICAPIILFVSGRNAREWVCCSASMTKLAGSPESSHASPQSSARHERECASVHSPQHSNSASARMFDNAASLGLLVAAALPIAIGGARCKLENGSNRWHSYHRFPIHEYCHATCRFW